MAPAVETLVERLGLPGEVVGVVPTQQPALDDILSTAQVLAKPSVLSELAHKSCIHR